MINKMKLDDPNLSNILKNLELLEIKKIEKFKFKDYKKNKSDLLKVKENNKFNNESKIIAKE